MDAHVAKKEGTLPHCRWVVCVARRVEAGAMHMVDVGGRGRQAACAGGGEGRREAALGNLTPCLLLVAVYACSTFPFFPTPQVPQRGAACLCSGAVEVDTCMMCIAGKVGSRAVHTVWGCWATHIVHAASWWTPGAQNMETLS